MNELRKLVTAKLVLSYSVEKRKSSWQSRPSHALEAGAKKRGVVIAHILVLKG